MPVPPFARALVAAVAFLASGCASLYRPPPSNVALFGHEDEVQVGGQLGTNGLGASVAWAPAPHVGLIGSGWGLVGGEDERRFEGELGVGSWMAGPAGLRGAVFAGVGLGRVRIRDETWLDLDLFGEDDPLLDGLLQRGFVQCEAGHVGRWVAFGGAGRVAAVRFDPVGEEGPGRAALTFEPALFVRGAFRHVQPEIQVGYRFVPRGELPGPTENPLIVSTGVRFVFGDAD